MARVVCITLNPALDTLFHLDELRFEKVNRPLQTHHYAAGKGINVATLLAALGHDVIVTGFLGENNATEFEQKFKACGFDNRFVYVQGATRQNIKITENSGRMTDINTQGFVINDDNIETLFKRLNDVLAEADMVVVAGSLPSGFGLDSLEKLLQTIKVAKVPLAVDTSGQALKTAILLSPDLIKPNTDELSEAFWGVYDTAEAQRQLFAMLATQGVLVKNVVVSMGEKGANWLHQKGVLHATPPTVEMVSTVGAGDTMLAGMVHGLLSQEIPEQIFRRATAMSAHTVSVVGVSLPDDDRLMTLMAKTAIVSL